MKTVGTRYAQTHLTKLLRELPFQITRFGKAVAVVSKVDKTRSKILKKAAKTK